MTARGLPNGTMAEALIGVAVTAVALALLGFFYVFGHSGGGAGYEVTARMAKVDGLGIGTEVRLAGIKVGSVTSLELDPATYLVTAHLRIENAIKIPTDSSLLINSAGVLGASYLSITPGGDDKMIASGGAIQNTQSANTGDIMNMVGRFTTGNGGGQ